MMKFGAVYPAMCYDIGVPEWNEMLLALLVADSNGNNRLAREAGCFVEWEIYLQTF